MRNHVPLCAAIGLALLLVVLMPSAEAYTVRYAYVKSPQPMTATEGDSYCKTDDVFAHGMMPTTELAQKAGFAALQKAGIDRSPIAGQSRTASCLDDCSWTFMDGFFYLDPYTFYNGIVMQASNGTRIVGSSHTDIGPGGVVRDGAVYCGFDSCSNPQTGSFPQFWANQSYYGQRKVVMTSTGEWQNVDYLTTFTDYICEYYDYEEKDAARFNLATYPDGSIIPRVPFSNLTYCDKALTISNDGVNSYWIYARCNSPFPWWGALLIAVGAFIVVAAIIIIIFCCCCHCRNRTEEKRSDERNRTTEDNPARVPTQSQIGMSRASTLNADQDDYEDDDQDVEDERN